MHSLYGRYGGPAFRSGVAILGALHSRAWGTSGLGAALYRMMSTHSLYGRCGGAACRFGIAVFDERVDMAKQTGGNPRGGGGCSAHVGYEFFIRKYGAAACTFGIAIFGERGTSHNRAWGNPRGGGRVIIDQCKLRMQPWGCCTWDKGPLQNKYAVDREETKASCRSDRGCYAAGLAAAGRTWVCCTGGVGLLHDRHGVAVQQILLLRDGHGVAGQEVWVFCRIDTGLLYRRYRCAT
jgi:hypothetical protein